MNTNSMLKRVPVIKLLTLAGIAVSLAACSGGGGSSSSTQLGVSGTSAIGKALDGANIALTCAAGTGNTVSNATGGFTVTVVNGKGPCMLTATKGTTILHSVTPGAGVANVTPLTELLARYLATRAGTSIDNLLSNVNGKAILGDAIALNDAQSAMITFLNNKYTLSLTTNFLTAVITPLQGGVQSPADKDLDDLALKGALSVDGTPIAALITDIIIEAQKAPPYVAPTGATGI